TGWGSTQNPNEVESAPACSCSGAGKTNLKFCWRIPADPSTSKKTTAHGQSQRARRLREKICSHALRLNSKRRSVSAPKLFATTLSSAQSYKRAAKLCTAGRSKVICQNHLNANQICSKWNGHRVPVSARCFQRSIGCAFFLTPLRDANSSRHRCRFLIVYAPRSRLISPGGHRSAPGPGDDLMIMRAQLVAEKSVDSIS